jgi:adenine-specific DNA-methyltransferase
MIKRQEAEKLLEGTFNKEFNLETFVSFIRELLKGRINISMKSLLPHSQFEEYIKSFKKIGEYHSGKDNIEILSVELKSSKRESLERARTMQRNFVATWLKSAQIPKDGALVAFHGENLEDWRFSFVKMDYKLGEDGKVIKELTPAKRLSYLVGKNEPNHTCKKQFLYLLSDKEKPPTIEEIEKAFSVENVTKEFFDLYKQCFFDLRDSLEEVIKKNSAVKKDFELKQINSTEFTKKLLGQIVFLYFLQKKGWLGVKKNKEGILEEWGTGPKDFMTRLFEGKIVKYNNFFDDILEPLFYEALAKPRDEDYYSRFECKIPFLNGGLFEAIKDYDWVNTKIQFDNETFRKILIDTFDKFNFTIKEDEPLEREVAIDPEMLGKVFENLLDVNDRKSKGAFYTPREIVHYMCQQSLINYLETNTTELKISREDLEKFILKGDLALDYLRRAQDPRRGGVEKEFMLPETIYRNVYELDKLLRNIKICDPAVGSGAFPVGMMNEIVKARQILGYFLTEKKKSDYELKRETIENSLYGVDIEPSAVEITKLRFWLSLIVEEEDIHHIKPLPNLENKIMCGNSLIDEFEGIKLYIDPTEIKERKDKQSTLDQSIEKKVKKSEQKLKELRQKQKEFFDVENRTKKKQLKEEIDRIEWEFIEETLREQGDGENMKKLEQYKKNKSKPFFLWKLYFNDVFYDNKGHPLENPGFDVVIANPPYVGHKGGQKKLFQELKKTEFGKRFNNERMDLFYYFFHLAIDKVKNWGNIAFITTNYYITADSAVKLRKDLKERVSILKLVNFNELKIFDSARGQHNMLTFLQKRDNKDEICEIFLTNRNEVANPNLLLEILSKSDKKTTYYDLKQSELYEGEMNYIRIFYGKLKNKKRFEEILNKLKDGNGDLDSICYLSQGMVSGLDKISRKHITKFPELIEHEGEGVYVVDKKRKDEIGKSLLFKPWFKNSDINKYKVNESNSLWIIQTHTQLDLNNFGNIQDHLMKYEKVIKTRNYDSGELSKAKKLGKWWAMSSSRREFDFSMPKIVSPQRSYQNTFAYTLKEWTASADVYFITLKDKDFDLKYILSLLNSKLYYLWLYFRGKRKGEMLELYLTPLSQIPIKKISLEKQKPFIEIVNKVLEITDDEDYIQNSEKQAKVKAYEKKIDQMVYKLYELTPEEIKIVEGFGK